MTESGKIIVSFPRRRDALDHVGSRMVEDGLRIGSNCQPKELRDSDAGDLVRHGRIAAAFVE